MNLVLSALDVIGADLRLNSSFKDRGTVLVIPGELELPGVD